MQMQSHTIDSFLKSAVHRFLKPKQCEWDRCGRKFYNDYECFIHVKEDHSPKKHVKCLWSECTFISSNCNNNVNHVKKHISLVQGICITCNSTFKWSFDLKRHNKNIHNDKSTKSLKSVNIFGMRIVVSQQDQDKDKIGNDKIAFLLN